MKTELQTIYFNNRPVKHFPKGRHRSAWVYYYGEEIGKDEKGRSYEVHHIDGNHSNNLPWNLKLVTIEEHYSIHYEQKDWGACVLMAERMELDPEEFSKLSTLSNQQRVEERTHHLLSENRKPDVRYGGITSETSTRVNAERIENGTHNWLKDENGNSLSSERVKNRTHNFLKENRKPDVVYGSFTSESAKRITREAIENGTHNCVKDNPQRQKWKCVVTGKVTNKRSFTVMAKHRGLDKWPHELVRVE